MDVSSQSSFHENLKAVFDNYFDKPEPSFVKQYSLLESASESPRRRISFSHHDHDPVLAIRELYGKGPVADPAIGDHPDFEHLKGTEDTCCSPITTMFMDIESSTRLSLLFPLDDVRRIKNAFIQAAIQIIRSFDGHVHRIMGDAVMAYFGRTFQPVEDGIIAGLNCAAALQYFVEHIVIPKLHRHGYNHDFGIRIGLDYGHEDHVLWSSYGFPGVDEVTATSFYVDIAAKLQQAAGRNEVMVGQSIVDCIEFPRELLQKKKVIQDGRSVTVQFVLPNHSNREGQLLNYKQFVLNSLDYLRCSPVAAVVGIAADDTIEMLPVDVTIHLEKCSTASERYAPASRAIPKERWLRFKPQFSFVPPLPYVVECSVENHGREAARAENNGNHSTRYTITNRKEHEQYEHWETTRYRGLHYLTVNVHVRDKLRYSSRLGVFVQ